MKTFKASRLQLKPSEVMKAAREGGAIIQECRTNGEVMQEYVLIVKDKLVNIPVVDKQGNESVIVAAVVGDELNQERSE